MMSPPESSGKWANSEDVVIFLLNFIWAVPCYVNNEPYFKLFMCVGCLMSLLMKLRSLMVGLNADKIMIPNSRNTIFKPKTFRRQVKISVGKKMPIWSTCKWNRLCIQWWFANQVVIYMKEQTECFEKSKVLLFKTKSYAKFIINQCNCHFRSKN